MSLYDFSGTIPSQLSEVFQPLLKVGNEFCHAWKPKELASISVLGTIFFVTPKDKFWAFRCWGHL